MDHLPHSILQNARLQEAEMLCIEAIGVGRQARTPIVVSVVRLKEHAGGELDSYQNVKVFISQLGTFKTTQIEKISPLRQAVDSHRAPAAQLWNGQEY